MNRKEWAEHHNYSKELYILHKKLKQWKLDNGITECCVIHHRDDTPETIEYNEKYYERWGFNEDGTFEYGKYVVFMTRSEHIGYHSIGNTYGKNAVHSEESRQAVREKVTGERNGMYGKPSPFRGAHHTEEAKEKNRQAHLGLHPSDITRKRMSDTMKRQLKCISLSYHKYRENGGQLKWSAYRSALSNGTIQLEGITNDCTNNT